MPKPITKKQLSDFWLNNFCPKGYCCICGNTGVIDTRGKVRTPAGFECGAMVYCGCPNGRAQLRAQLPL